jgi:hypothetical protein
MTSVRVLRQVQVRGNREDPGWLTVHSDEHSPEAIVEAYPNSTTRPKVVDARE